MKCRKCDANISENSIIIFQEDEISGEEEDCTEFLFDEKLNF